MGARDIAADVHSPVPAGADGAESTSLPAVVAIVLNWNLPEQTLACVESLFTSDYPNLRVIIVDNGSTDGSPDILRMRLPGVEMLALPENRGYAAGNNAGMRRALALGAEWILIVNNDAILAPDSIRELIARTTPAAGLAMPRIDALPSGRLWHAGSRLVSFYPLPRAVPERELSAGRPILIDYAVGCVLLIRRRVVETIGLLDERYFMYYEDLDFSSRARAAGFQIVVVPTARAWHRVGASLRTDTSRRTYLQTRYRTLWCRSQKLNLRALAWWGALVAGSVRVSVGAATRLNWRLIAAVSRGLRDGMRDPTTRSEREQMPA